MSEATKKGIDEAETGGEGGAPRVVKEQHEHPEDAEAAEQTRGDGPEGRGVER